MPARSPAGIADSATFRRQPFEYFEFSIGTRHAPPFDVAGANRFEDLTVWQRMHKLNIEVWKATMRGAAGRDFRFANEIRDAADSAERNVAEGFGRFNPGEFARFLDISRASALETQTLLRKGLSVGYWSKEEFRRLNTLATRGLQAIAKFQRYLRSPRAKRNAACRYTRKCQNAPNVHSRNVNDPNANDPND